MTAFIHSAIMVFVAEIGDRTQFLAIALSQQFSFVKVLLGITIGTLLLHLVSVFLGNSISHFFALKIVNIFLGLIILFFAISFAKEIYESIRNDSSDESSDKIHEIKLFRSINPIFGIAIIFTMAEFGDKTMFTTCSLAVKYSQYWQVFFGSSIGLLGADVLAILVYKFFKNYINLKYANILACCIFTFFGFTYILQGIS